MIEYQHPDQLGPCPECGGPRALFELYTPNSAIVLQLDHNLISPTIAYLYTCTCLTCGATTLRPRLSAMPKVRKAAEKQFKR